MWHRMVHVTAPPPTHIHILRKHFFLLMLNDFIKISFDFLNEKKFKTILTLHTYHPGINQKRHLDLLRYTPALDLQRYNDDAIIHCLISTISNYQLAPV